MRGQADLVRPTRQPPLQTSRVRKLFEAEASAGATNLPPTSLTVPSSGTSKIVASEGRRLEGQSIPRQSIIPARGSVGDSSRRPDACRGPGQKASRLKGHSGASNSLKRDSTVIAEPPRKKARIGTRPSEDRRGRMDAGRRTLPRPKAPSRTAEYYSTAHSISPTPSISPRGRSQQF